MTSNTIPRFRRGERVVDPGGNICIVSTQVHDKVWTFCNPQALDASALRGTDAGFGLPEQYPQDARVPL